MKKTYFIITEAKHRYGQEIMEKPIGSVTLV